jgi:diguanylate cyclase (GGDEF)-like protein
MPVAATSRNFSTQTSRLIAPLALVLFGVFVLCAVFGYALARESDARHQDQRRASLLGVVDEFRNVFANMTADAAADLAANGLTDPADIARALTPVGLARYRHERAGVIGGDGAVIASDPDHGHPVAEIARVIAEFRASPARPGATGADAGEFAPVVTEVVLLDGAPALVAVAAAAVRRPGVSGPLAPQTAVLVRTKRLDAGLIGVFETMSGVSALAFDAEAPHGDRDLQSLMDPQGRIVGWLTWQREHPTMDAVVRLLPLIGAVAAMLVLFAASAIRQISRATARLASSEAEAHKIAYEDPVTGLPNRRMMFDLLDAALAQRAGGGVSFALIDLDHFADIMEALGEQGSEELLAAAAAQLRGAMPGAVTLGRVGPSEFALVAADRDAAAGLGAAHAAAKVMARPLWIANQAVQSGVTVGLVHAPDDGETREELMRRADLARRSIEPGNTLRVAGFDPEMEKEFQDRLFIKRELRRTLTEQGFDVHYQPIVAAEGQKIVGVEALMRWNHPTRGMISPADFIPVAEQTGLMPQLGEFVLRRALADAVRWKDTYIAVNISPHQMRDRGFVGLVAAVLADTGIAPCRVMLEVTEGVLIEKPDEAKERLAQLRALGVKIALDDFGSGYSSLSYLRRFPIDKLKIDKEFVSPLGRSSDGGVIIQAIMALGRALGLTVLCEGVETEEQRILLRLAGCDEMQGFLFAKPAPRAAIDRMILGGEGRRATA